MNTQRWAEVAALLAGLLLIPPLLRGRKAPLSMVAEKIKAGAFVVDVRTPEEFRGGAYPGAINIPLSDLGRRCGEIPRDRAVILYCASGMRSASAVRLLRQAGFTDVINGGGLSAMPPLR